MMNGSEKMEKIDKEKFIEDIKKDLGIQERNHGDEYKFDTFDGLDDLDKIFEFFFKKNVSNENDFNNPNNIVIDCKINKGNTKREYKKLFKYKRNNNGLIEKRKIEITIPAHIKNGQKILVRGEGNIEPDLLGNLIIKINIKNYRRKK